MTNNQFIDRLVGAGALHTPHLVEAFRAVDRKDFVPEGLQEEAYVDAALPLGHGVTISQPSTVAFMLEQLRPKAGQRVLDIGAGSGWTTALLAYIVGSGGFVYATEIIHDLVEQARQRLHAYHFSWVRIEEGGHELGRPYATPFDRILVSAAGKEIPLQLVEQLEVNGRMVVPVRHSLWRVDKYGKEPEEIRTDEFPGFMFVPLRA